MKTDFKSILLLQLCFLMQNVRSKHHHHTRQDSDEDSQSQDNESDSPNEIPIVSLESPIPINIPQMNQLSMSLPQLLFPQMSMPSTPMTAGSFATSLLTGQSLVFFRVPSSYFNILNSYQPTVSTTSATTTTSNIPTSPATSTTTTTVTTTTTLQTPTNNTLLNVNLKEVDSTLLTYTDMLNNNDTEIEAINDLRRVIVNGRNNDDALESVLHSIMNEFANRMIKTQQNNMNLNGRRSMQSRVSTKNRHMRTIPQFRILPIPNDMAKSVLLNLRAVKKKST